MAFLIILPLYPIIYLNITVQNGTKFCTGVHGISFPQVFSSTNLRLTFLVFPNMSGQLLDGMPWSLLQTSTTPQD